MVPILSANSEDPDSILASGRSPGEGHGNPLQYSFLEPDGLWFMGSQKNQI